MPRSMPRLVTALALAASALAGNVVSAQDMPPNATEVARRALHVCASCHGEGGRSTDGQYPSLAGHPAHYVAQQLMDFRAQQRGETDSRAYMWGISALLDDATIKSLAEYYAAQKPAPGRTEAKPEVLARGKQIYENGIPGTKVRACASCHGASAEGVSVFPRLAGQHAPYLVRQLDVFGTKLRPHGKVMQDEVAQLSKADREAVAQYLQSLN